MLQKNTNIPTILVLLSIFSSCSIRTKGQYNETKLSKIVEQQIKETIDNEVIDDVIQLQKAINQIEHKNSQLQKRCDSLFLLYSKPIAPKSVLNTYVFFNSSDHAIDQVSIKNLRNVLLNIKETEDIQKCKFNLTGYSDASGDSVINISLAEKRVLNVKNLLINEFCIPSSSITTISIPNVITCNYSLYRSVKINIDNNIN